MGKRAAVVTIRFKVAMACAASLGLAGCGDGDFDLRGALGGGALDTSGAAQTATNPRPEPDSRGVISYPNYQVAVARRDDTVGTIADRLGLSASELGRFNGLSPDTALRKGEILALPRRVALPDNTIETPASVDITDLASGAIDRAPADALRAEQVTSSALPSGPEPVRHRVERGETAFTIARLYAVPVQSLAEWNGLPSDLSVREGQFLLIPVAGSTTPSNTAVTAPGQGSSTPTPPSSVQPQPAEDTSLSDQPTQQSSQPAASDVGLTAPDIGQTAQAETPKSDFRLPVQGAIIRGYSKGRNEGIDISASAGTAVKAAASGTVAAITRDANNQPIIVVRHDGSLLTVYTQVADPKVKQGDAVSRGQTIATVASGSPSFVHFEIRNGLESVNPATYLNI